jgi:septal ring factor EnvC (AmiA/AmiB activator)
MAVLVIGCCSFPFAKNLKKTVAAAPAPVADFEKKIEEKNLVLDSIKSELEKGREKLRRLQQEEGSFLLQIEQIEKNIAVSESYLAQVSIKIDSASRSIGALEKDLAATDRERAGRMETMKRRLRSIYKAGQITLPQVILTSRDMSDMLHRARYFRELNRYDRDLAAKIDTARMKIEGDKTSLEKEKKRLSAFKRAKESEYDAFVVEQTSRERLLGEVRSQKEAYVRMITELEAAQKELQNIVASLENRRKKVRTAYEKSLNATFEKRKGTLPWPVEGRLIAGFGRVVHSVYKTVTMNTGVDIGAQKGEKVYCVASGRVVYVGWMRGLGKLVIVDHGGYYTTYARLDESLVTKEDKVETGAALGRVGEINPFEASTLHFEIRQATEAMDPLDWLEDRKR